MKYEALMIQTHRFVRTKNNNCGADTRPYRSIGYEFNGGTIPGMNTVYEIVNGPIIRWHHAESCEPIKEIVKTVHQVLQNNGSWRDLKTAGDLEAARDWNETIRKVIVLE
jgi:hypothetical protein